MLLSFVVRRTSHPYRTRLTLMSWWPLSNVQEHDLLSCSVSLNTDRCVWMTPVTQCYKDPHTLQAFSDHPSLLEIIPDNIIVIMLYYTIKKPTPSEACKVLQLGNPFLFISEKKNQQEKGRQKKTPQNHLFFIPEIPTGWCRRHSLLFMSVNNESHKITWIQASMILLWVVMVAVMRSPKDGLSTFFLWKSRRFPWLEIVPFSRGKWHVCWAAFSFALTKKSSLKRLLKSGERNEYTLGMMYAS